MQHYLVLESCEGGDLFKTMMKAGGRLPEATVCVDVIVPLLRVLESLATLSLIHRDIKVRTSSVKTQTEWHSRWQLIAHAVSMCVTSERGVCVQPENIFLMADGTMKLGDFGLAIDCAAEIPFCRSGAPPPLCSAAHCAAAPAIVAAAMPRPRQTHLEHSSCGWG